MLSQLLTLIPAFRRKEQPLYRLPAAVGLTNYEIDVLDERGQLIRQVSCDSRAPYRREDQFICAISATKFLLRFVKFTNDIYVFDAQRGALVECKYKTKLFVSMHRLNDTTALVLERSSVYLLNVETLCAQKIELKRSDQYTYRHHIVPLNETTFASYNGRRTLSIHDTKQKSRVDYKCEAAVYHGRVDDTTVLSTSDQVIYIFDIKEARQWVLQASIENIEATILDSHVVVFNRHGTCIYNTKSGLDVNQRVSIQDLGDIETVAKIENEWLYYFTDTKYCKLNMTTHEQVTLFGFEFFNVCIQLNDVLYIEVARRKWYTLERKAYLQKGDEFTEIQPYQMICPVHQIIPRKLISLFSGTHLLKSFSDVQIHAS